MKDRDEEIQAHLDTGKPIAIDSDVIAYRQVYEMLGHAPVQLSTTFAYAVMSRILRERLLAKQSTTWLSSILVCLVALILSGATLGGLSAQGYVHLVSMPIAAWLSGIPLVSIYAGLCLLLVIIMDMGVNHLGIRPL